MMTREEVIEVGQRYLRKDEDVQALVETTLTLMDAQYELRRTLEAERERCGLPPRLQPQ
jgi:hypothetical protein